MTAAVNLGVTVWQNLIWIWIGAHSMSQLLFVQMLSSKFQQFLMIFFFLFVHVEEVGMWLTSLSNTALPLSKIKIYIKMF